MRFTLLILLLFSTPVYAARYVGFDRYTLVQGDVIFNPFNDQLRLTAINATNQSLTVQFVPATGSAYYDVVKEGGQLSYLEQCIILHKLQNQGPYFVVDLTWSPAACIRQDAPALQYLRVVQIGTNWATLSWQTNVPGNATIAYRTQYTPEREALINVFTTEETVRLANLRPGTPYYYRVTTCGQGTYGNCSSSIDHAFTTLSGEEYEGQEKTVAEYPLHRNTPVALQGFRIELVNASPGVAALALHYDGEDLCLSHPKACTITSYEENAEFLHVTGMQAQLKETASDTAMVSFSLSPNTRFPPAVIWRPSEKTLQVQTKSTIEILVYGLNAESRIVSANLTYEDGSETKRIPLQEGRNVVNISFQTAGTRKFRIEAADQTGLVANISKTIVATAPEVQAPTPTVIKIKKPATPTPVPTSTLSAIEKVRQKLAKEEKPFDAWAYSGYAIMAAGLLVLGVLLYLFVLKKKEPKTP